MKIGIFGAGRLSAEIQSELNWNEDLSLAWVVDKGETPTGKVDVAIDASVAEGVPEHLAWALETGTDLVIGATGWTMPDLERRVGQKIGVLVSTNFSLTVALMRRLALVVARFAELNPELDPYIVERHHKMKADAPSGTALTIAKAVMEGCTRKTEIALGPAQSHQLSVGVVRAGTQFGQHEVGLDGLSESLSITHTARSRAIFGSGAIQAARWLHGRKGVFSYEDFVGQTLEPLFQFGEKEK